MERFLAVPSRAFWAIWRLSRKVWVRTSLIAVMAIVAAASAPLLQWVIPEEIVDRFGGDAVRPILDVLAASMLTVTTFSLSVMVAAHRAASDNVTPRSHRLLLEDTTTQTVLATFLGAFIYALASIVLINAGVYTGRSIVVNFFFTIGVILLVVVAILRWIEHLSWLGSMLETTREVEAAATTAMRGRRVEPYLGARPASEAPDGIGHEVWPDRTGYVTHIDTRKLGHLARDRDRAIVLRALPGTFVAPGRAIAATDGPGLGDDIRQAFTVEDARSFDQDPRFGLIVLSEIASRALSPGINDPGTAIDVIGRVLRLLTLWEVPAPDVEGEAGGGRLYAPPLDPVDLLEDGLAGLARDGAGMIEVQLRLQKALAILARHPDPALAAAARHLAARAFDMARKALPHPDDIARLRADLPPGTVPSDDGGEG